MSTLPGGKKLTIIVVVQPKSPKKSGDPHAPMFAGDFEGFGPVGVGIMEFNGRAEHQDVHDHVELGAKSGQKPVESVHTGH